MIYKPLKKIGKLSMVPLSFGTLPMVTLSFLYYQWYPRAIKRFTTVIFLNFFRQKSFQTVNFLLCFELKNKIERKIVNSFRRLLTKKVLKSYGCKTLNSTRVPLIIKKN